MKLTMLGTGCALVKNYYNTCFLLEENEELFLVDGGGGSGILHQLDAAGKDWKRIHTIFVTHKHIDHLLGVIWMIRLISQGMTKGTYEGEAVIYANREVCELLLDLSMKLLNRKEYQNLGGRLRLQTVEDGDTVRILGTTVTFFDIHSTKAAQFGFCMTTEAGKKLTCCGDEPYNESEACYAEGSDWLLHEAFCLYAQADRYKPYEKHHSTAKDAGEIAHKLDVKCLLLYHTEDDHVETRRALYTAEAKQSFAGVVVVPEDLESLVLW